MKTEPAFTLEEIDDVRIIIKAKGKHYGLVPKNDKEQARLLRIVIAMALFDEHYVVDKSLEETKALNETK